MKRKANRFELYSYENEQLRNAAWINQKTEQLPSSPEILLWCCGESVIKKDYIRKRPTSQQPSFYWNMEIISSGSGKLFWHENSYELLPGTVLIYNQYGTGMEFRPNPGQELRKIYFGIASNPMLEYLCRIPSGETLDTVYMGEKAEQLNTLAENIFRLVKQDNESEYQLLEISMQLYGCITLVNRSRIMFDKMDVFSRMIFAIEHAAYRYKNVDMLVKEFQIPRRRIFWLFRKKLDTSPMDFIIRSRIELSCRYLVFQSASIEMIARQFGYKDPAFYARTFKKVMKMTPTQYREKNRVKVPRTC